MPTRRRSLPLLPLALLALAATPLAPAPARAQLLHRFFETVDVAHRRADDFELDQDGDVTAGNDANALGDILAQLDGPRFRGIASVGRFGDVGLLAELLTPPAPLDFHKLRSRALVTASPLVVNTFPYPVDVVADFVLDGGELFLVGTAGSFARYELSLTQPGLGDVFFASGRLEPGTGTGTFSAHGRDIGATLDRFGHVTIPLSFQSAALGRLLPGEQMYLAYHLEVEVGLGSGGEVASASFSDPFTHRGHGNPIAASLRLVPAGPVVTPEPATLALITTGALCVLRGRRRRGARD